MCVSPAGPAFLMNCRSLLHDHKPQDVGTTSALAIIFCFLTFLVPLRRLIWLFSFSDYLLKLDRDCPYTAWFSMKCAKTLNYSHKHAALFCWKKEQAHLCGHFWFLLLFVFGFAVRAAAIWALPRGLIYFFFFLFTVDDALHSASVISVDRSKDTKLGTRRADTLLTWKEVGV